MRTGSARSNDRESIGVTDPLPCPHRSQLSNALGYVATIGAGRAKTPVTRVSSTAWPDAGWSVSAKKFSKV